MNIKTVELKGLSLDFWFLKATNANPLLHEGRLVSYDSTGTAIDLTVTPSIILRTIKQYNISVVAPNPLEDEKLWEAFVWVDLLKSKDKRFYYKGKTLEIAVETLMVLRTFGKVIKEELYK